MSSEASGTIRGAVSEEQDFRRTRRHLIRGILVAVDAPAVAEHPWVVDAIDINAHGIALVLPPELEPETEVLLSFSLDDETELSRVPGTLRHREGDWGGVDFGAWSDADRLRLLEYLVRRYEAADAQTRGDGETR